MPRLIKDGKVICEHPTRAQCIVEAFERQYVYVRRFKKHLIEGVSIEGVDGDVKSSYVSPLPQVLLPRKDFDPGKLSTKNVKTRRWL